MLALQVTANLCEDPSNLEEMMNGPNFLDLCLAFCRVHRGERGSRVDADSPTGGERGDGRAGGGEGGDEEAAVKGGVGERDGEEEKDAEVGVELGEKEKQVLLCGLRCMCKLTSKPKNHAQFLRTGGLQLLVMLANKHDDPEVYIIQNPESQTPNRNVCTTTQRYTSYKTLHDKSDTLNTKP
jgi:hypothetical protein